MNFTDIFIRKPVLASTVSLLILVLGLKATVLVVVQIWVRWTLPRLRIDQVMTTCLNYLVPIACFLFLGSTIWSLALPGRSAFGFSDRLGERMPVAERTAASAVATRSIHEILSPPAPAHAERGAGRVTVPMWAALKPVLKH